MDSEMVMELLRDSKLITNGPFWDRISSDLVGKGSEYFSFTVRLLNDGDRKIGKSFLAKILFFGKLGANPYTGEVVRGERWYHGTMHIKADPAMGIIEEERAFFYEVITRKGRLEKRGVTYRLTEETPSGEYKQVGWSLE